MKRLEKWFRKKCRAFTRASARARACVCVCVCVLVCVRAERRKIETLIRDFRLKFDVLHGGNFIAIFTTLSVVI